jgi:hypothetical protein
LNREFLLGIIWSKEVSWGLVDVFFVGMMRKLCIIFVDCSFTKDIWSSILKDLKLKNYLVGGQIVECLQNWIRKELNWKEIPCFVCWEVWMHKNLVSFEDHPPNLVRVCSRILQALCELKSPKDTKISRVVRPHLLDCDLANGVF